ncbi:MAG: ThiF family adenylyltransferase [Sphingomonadales bacterium]|nr:ThiF family adenylyltransferase [Sphingomonadales bacterium]MBK6492492.1 ThiF family adenylyltransferase [Sphingomonadales bacterium]MBK6720636.1 ThiF family adenylyltransferase [Sphingomonadales bacterium]MBK8273819.1 ThiF family adenylyltransferase [Sphingomonadales bacterium]MBK8861220.1 ThiF family adenylyltransferase [Sphingomonadales bacterium]
MSYKLIELNDDLRSLRDLKFNVDIVGAFLIVRDIPYVNAERQVHRDGILVTELTLSGDKTIAPERHQMRFIGECPCDSHGVALDAIRPSEQKHRINSEVTCDFEFSNKPRPEGYLDHAEKVRNYAALISGPASTIDPTATPMTGNVVEPGDDESPFNYLDTNSAKAQISVITEKLAADRIAIVGLGGTGSYVLDLIAKTPVKEIHLYDGDKFSSHNAFRAPGAASVEELRAQPLKVHYLRDIYARMHRGIQAHPDYVDESNVAELAAMSCVFLCMDAGPGKRLIVDALEQTSVPFLDASMGLYEKKEKVGGILQVVTSGAQNRAQARGRMSLADADEPNEYDQNIQVADLNALNAQIAVMRWKKMCGFYHQFDRANFNSFTVGNSLFLNEDLYGED